MCLMTSNPAHNYVKVMQGIKNGNLKFNKPEDIYNYFYSLTSQSVYGDDFSFIESFKKIFDTTLNKMKSYIVNIPKITSDFYDWINKIEEFVTRFRVNDQYYFLKLSKDFNLKTNNCFSSTLKSIGSPIISDINKHYFKIPYGNCTIRTDIEYFKAIGQIIHLFEYGIKSCSLFEWCKNSSSNPTNSFCTVSPWKKCSENNLCFYAMLWKYWNLIGYTPQN